MQALAERGHWVGAPRADAEILRVELRRAARRRRVRVRTGYGIDYCIVAWTPDGLPAEEPWRGMAEHVYESEDLMRLLVRQAIESLPQVDVPDARD